MPSTHKRPLHAAGCSCSCTDRREALARLAKLPDLDFIQGDWMSEFNMTTCAGDVLNGLNAWEVTMIEALKLALQDLAKNKIKFAATPARRALASLLKRGDKIARAQGLNLSVAWVSGDEVWDKLSEEIKADASTYVSLTTEKDIKQWGEEPICAQAYLGGFGVAAAFEQGADIVICGRVADASPLIGAAAWWHVWTRDSIDELAGAFVAGHFTECHLSNRWTSIGYPLVDIHADGSSVVGLEPGQDGLVDVATCTAQLVYEIQGPLYYNSDVVADLRTVQFEQVSITARGGYQAECRYFLCGLDITEKAAMTEAQVRNGLPDLSKLSLLKCMVTGTSGVNPDSQDEATVEFRVFAQAHESETLEPANFLRPISDQIMQGYPGSTFDVDNHMAVPKPFYEYFVTMMPQSRIEHQAHLLNSKQTIDIPPPTPLSSYGPTMTGPLGWIVHGRSDDKGSDANAGVFVRQDDEYQWLKDLLTIDKVKTLLGQDYKDGKRIERFELPHLKAVHFLLKDHLDRGVASLSTYDVLGKNVAEYLRCKHVELPRKFLERGKI